MVVTGENPKCFEELSKAVEKKIPILVVKGTIFTD